MYYYIHNIIATFQYGHRVNNYLLKIFLKYHNMKKYFLQYHNPKNLFKNTTKHCTRLKKDISTIDYNL